MTTTAQDREKIIKSLSERRELKDAARALLADKAFAHVFWMLREQWYGELIALPHDGPKQAEAAARLRGLEDFLTQLASLLDDERNAQRRHHAS